MTLCHFSDDLDLSLAESQVLQPHNSTFIEEDLDVELKDIIPQDLSAILGEFFLLACLFVCFDLFT